MNTEAGLRLALYAGPQHDCSYLPGRQARFHYVDPEAELTPELYGWLLHHGFRRSGNFVYRPACASCRQCIAARVPVARFQPNRSQRRCRRINADLSAELFPAHLTDEHFALYRRYIAARHGDGSMADPGLEDCRRFLLSTWCKSHFLELRLDGELLAVAVCDLVPSGISAFYTFFDPDWPNRGLGSYAVMAQIEIARQTRRSYLYLGYWVADCPKMTYKSRFRPLETFTSEGWRRIERGEPMATP